MAERIKMPRIQRAGQFAPFDALKGLQDALRLVEYNHERVAKSELTQEQIEKISETLLSLEKNSVVKLQYFSNGHILTYQGKVKLEIEKHQLSFEHQVVKFDDLQNLSIIEP